MTNNARSLNIANSVSIVAYEALRQNLKILININLNTFYILKQKGKSLYKILLLEDDELFASTLEDFWLMKRVLS